MGVQMDPASFLLWLLRSVCACLCVKDRASVCLCNTLAIVEAGSYQLHPMKTAGKGGPRGGGGKKKSHAYSSKKKYIITLSQSTMLPVGQS